MKIISSLCSLALVLASACTASLDEPDSVGGADSSLTGDTSIQDRDPRPDPVPDEPRPSCEEEAYARCAAAGGTPERCRAHVEYACGDPEASCYDQVFQPCYEAGGDREACWNEALRACAGSPGDPGDPRDPGRR